MEHGTRHSDDETPATRAARQGLAYVLFLVLLLAGAAIYGLRVLEHMPYRPPDDMSTMLGGEELAAVRGLIVVFGIVWCAAFVAFVAVCWPRRRAS